MAAILPCLCGGRFRAAGRGLEALRQAGAGLRPLGVLRREGRAQAWREGVAPWATAPRAAHPARLYVFNSRAVRLVRVQKRLGEGLGGRPYHRSEETEQVETYFKNAFSPQEAFSLDPLISKRLPMGGGAFCCSRSRLEFTLDSLSLCGSSSG